MWISIPKLFIFPSFLNNCFILTLGIPRLDMLSARTMVLVVWTYKGNSSLRLIISSIFFLYIYMHNAWKKKKRKSNKKWDFITIHTYHSFRIGFYRTVLSSYSYTFKIYHTLYFIYCKSEIYRIFIFFLSNFKSDLVVRLKTVKFKCGIEYIKETISTIFFSELLNIFFKILKF